MHWPDLNKVKSAPNAYQAIFCIYRTEPQVHAGQEYANNPIDHRCCVQFTAIQYVAHTLSDQELYVE